MSGENPFTNPEQEVHTLPQRMEPELIERIPTGFTDFVQQYPEDSLPDYQPFAHQVTDTILNHSDRSVVLLAPKGIGKTTQLIPAIIDQAQSAGLDIAGTMSLSNVGGILELVLDPHEHFRASEFDITKSNYNLASYDMDRRFLATGRGGEYRKYIRPGEGPGDQGDFEYFKSTLNSLLAAHPGGLYIIDEAGTAFLDVNTRGHDIATNRRLIKHICDEAAKNNVKLLFISPEPPLEDRDQEGTDAWLKELSGITNRSALPVEVQAQPVGMEAARDLICAFGLIPQYEERFERNPDTRLLRVFEQFVNLLAYRTQMYQDELLTFEQVRRLGEVSTQPNWLLHAPVDQIGWPHDHNIDKIKSLSSALGLSDERLAGVKRSLFADED